MVYTWTHGIDNTHDIDLGSWYSNVFGKVSWYRLGLMVLTRTHVTDTDTYRYRQHPWYLVSWYKIGAHESQMYKCCLYAVSKNTQHRDRQCHLYTGLGENSVDIVMNAQICKNIVLICHNHKTYLQKNHTVKRRTN